MSGISTHVLDTSTGRPAHGVAVLLERWELDAWLPCATSATDSDGRCHQLLAASRVAAGTYRLVFATAAYFSRDGRHTFFPEVAIAFEVPADGGNFHVPLLVSPFSYTTYRGS